MIIKTEDILMKMILLIIMIELPRIILIIKVMKKY